MGSKPAASPIAFGKSVKSAPKVKLPSWMSCPATSPLNFIGAMPGVSPSAKWANPFEICNPSGSADLQMFLPYLVWFLNKSAIFSVMMDSSIKGLKNSLAESTDAL